MNKPKILVTSDTYYPLMDGVLKFLEEFIKRSRGSFDISFLVPKLTTKRIKGIKTIFFKTSRRFKASIYPVPQISFRNLRKIRETIKESELVFAHGPGTVGFFLSLRYARKYGKKNVLYIHNTAWDFLDKYLSLRKFSYRLLKNFSVKFYNRWDMLIVPYPEVKKELKREGVRTEIQVAKLGMDINKFLPAKDKHRSKKKLKLPDKIIVGYVGRICKEKNTLVLLEAFKRLDPNKFFLLMVGDGNPDIVQEFKEYKNCKVTGFVDDVEEHLQAMDAFVMPSLTETTSLATLEAMSCGLPVIVSKVGYMKEYIKRDHNGLFFPRTNPAVLALKIEKLFKDDHLRERIGRNARKTVAYAFSWERSINKIKRILLKFYYSG